VYFGSHRRAQGVIVPVDVWEQLVEQAEDEVDMALSKPRLVNRPAPPLTRGYLDGALSRAAEVARRTA